LGDWKRELRDTLRLPAGGFSCTSFVIPAQPVLVKTGPVLAEAGKRESRCRGTPKPSAKGLAPLHTSMGGMGKLRFGRDAQTTQTPSSKPPPSLW
jgi:hypothetical protein